MAVIRPLLAVSLCALLFTGVAADCPEGWFRAGDYCYWLADTALSFEDGQGLCATKEASLVSLSTPKDLNATLVVARASPGTGSLWTCLLFDPKVQGWAWLDGSVYTAASVPWWGESEPQIHGGAAESCAVLESTFGQMHRSVCTVRATPVCRRSAYKRELCNEADGWGAIGTSCYKFFSDKLTWFDADKTCRDHSATLMPLPFSDTVASVIQQTVVCDLPDNDVWISSVDVSSPFSRCNFVTVMYNQILQQDKCLMERKFLCQKAQGSCSQGWLAHEGRCYMSPSLTLPWFSAGKFCQHLGATMLIISDEVEEQFIQTRINSGTFAPVIWLGLSDQKQQGSFQWSDGSPVSSPGHWSPDFPKDTPAVNCGYMLQARTGDSYWANGYCYISRPFVCEMSVSADVRNVTQTDSCDPGWRLAMPGGSTCFLLGDDHNYTAAAAFCRASGGHLATVHSPQDQADLSVIIAATSAAWLGLRRYGGSSHFTWEDDGTTVNTSNWLPGQPQVGTGGGSRDCVQMVGAATSTYTGAWQNRDCGTAASFVCQKAANVSSVSPQPGTMVTAAWSWRCGEGWLLSPTLSACFLLVQDVTVPWAAARAQCLQHGADLVSITSYREQTVVEALVRSAGLAEGEGAWSGLWTGATDNSREGGWEWTDSAPFRYLHWSAGQPDNRGWSGEEQNCAVVVPADTLMWDDRDCDELHNYICKKTAAPESTTTPVTGIPTQPSGQCEGQPMLSGVHSVADSMLNASSSSDDNHRPEKSRIFPTNTACWMSAASDKAPWVGVSFETLVTVRAVQTTGSGSGETRGSWASHYTLQYRYDNTAPLYWYSDPPGTLAKVFTANNDSDTPVTQHLSFPMAARQVYLYPSQWTGPAPALRWEIWGCLEDECRPDYAISGPLVVPSNKLNASSSSDPKHDSSAARLNPLAAGMLLSCWRPSVQDSSQWIQADFERVAVLRGVSTRGNPTVAEWVRTYQLLYHPDVLPSGGPSWRPYEEPYGSAKVFTGNVDHNSTVTHFLQSFIPARGVRLQPQIWQGHIALQFDILVCQAGCEEQGLLTKVSDQQLTATSSQDRHGPQESRLTGSADHPTAGGWQAQFTRADQYIQVSLNVPQEVRAVATQGRQQSNSWLTAFYLSWSLDGQNWTNYSQGGHLQRFSGNYDSVSVRKHYVTPFLAQYVRLHPTLWVRSIALHWDLYGCPGKNGYQPVGCFTDHANDRDLPYEPYTDLLDGMDPSICTRHCFNKGYAFAGLQSRDKCFCGNSFGRYGVSAECNLRCFPRLEFNCGGLTASHVFSTGLTSGFSVCPAGWKRLRDQCYHYVSEVKDWVSARASCVALQADLASVSDRSVNTLLYSLMGEATEHSLAWIGLNDEREERYFEWSDQEEVVYTDWDLYQPAPAVTGDSRHCVAINNQTGGWVTAACDRPLPYLCMSRPTTSNVPPSVTAAPVGCQQGMFAYQSFCYVVVEENRTQADAKDVCTEFGGKLLVVANRFQQAFLTSLLSDRSGLYWTDVSDLHNPGVFTYEQGQYDVTYTNWDSGMPDSRRRGHCVAVGSGQGSGLWRSQPCGQPLKAVCTVLRDGYSQPDIPVTPHRSNCSTGWVDTNSSLCYQINSVDSSLQRSWTEARADCQEQRSDLASFPTTPLMEYFWRYKLLGSSNHFWVGLHALPNGDLVWSDGSSVSVDGPWSAGQPDTANGTRTCVELHAPSGTLALTDCRLPRNWLCSIQSGFQPFQRLPDRLMPTAGPAGSCYPLDDTWKRYGEYCYTVISDQPATWRQARRQCQQHHGDLASVVNMQENMFILGLARKTLQQTVWIGLSELMSNGGYFGWSDGSSVRFTYFAGNGPDDADGQESCVEMLASTGKWNDDHCALAQGFACKRQVGSFPPTLHTTLAPILGGCGDGGWVVFDTRCFLILGRQRGSQKTWQEAFADCKGRSTPFVWVALASVRGPRESAFLTTQLSSTGTQAWLGLRRVNHTLLWVDEEEMTFTHWDTGEPNGGTQERCVMVYGEGANAGRWNDVDCSRRMAWICESNRVPNWNVPTTPASHCPSGFQRLGTSCYLFHNDSQLPWAGAESFCKGRGAHLISINSQVEQDFVFIGITGGDPKYYYPSTTIYPPVWLGLYGTQVQNATLWSWSDGWPVTYSHWGPGGFLNVSSTTHCVTMGATGAWSNQDCSSARPFVCEINSATPPYTLDPASGACEGQEWIATGGHCYAFYATQLVTFAQADFECSQRGASLASVHSADVSQFLQSQVQAMSARPVWIGFRRRDQEAFVWRDGSEVDFTNWDTGFPVKTSADGSSTRCVHLSPWNGRWIDDDCGAQYGYVCMKNMVYEASTQSSGPSGSNSPVPRRAALRSERRVRERNGPGPVTSTIAAPLGGRAPAADTAERPSSRVTHPVTRSRHDSAINAGGKGSLILKFEQSAVDGRTSSDLAADVRSGKTPTSTGKEENQASDPNKGDGRPVVMPAVTAGMVALVVVAVVAVVVVFAVVVVLVQRRRREGSASDFTRRLYQQAY